MCNCKIGEQAPVKSGTIDVYTRVADHGRESIHGRVLFVFTIYDSYNHEDKLKFGARSSEEAAKWMQAFKEAAEQVDFISLFVARGKDCVPNFAILQYGSNVMPFFIRI